MKGYWYIPAIAALCSVLGKISDGPYFFIGLLVWLFYLYQTKRLGKLPIMISLTCFLFFSFFIPQINIASTNPIQENMVLSGEIVSSITTTDSILQFRFRESTTNQLIQIIHFNQINNHVVLSTIQHGAECTLVGEVRFPAGSTNPGQFNYQKYLASSGVLYEMEVASLDDIACNGASKKNILYSIREFLMDTVSKHYPDRTSAWIKALVFGDDDTIPSETIEVFRRWGISHLLAISGLHIGLVVGLLYFLTIKVNLLTKEKAQWGMVIFLPIYATLAGEEPSVWRASLMVILVILVQKVKITFSVTDVLSLIFLFLLLLDPYSVYHVGFQLSFIVTFGILLSKRWLIKTNSLFFQMLKLSFISQLMIVPLQIIYFYNFNPLSIILNILVVPYFSFFVIPLMFLLLVLSPIPLLSTLIEQFFSFIHNSLFLVLLDLIDQVAYYPWIMGSFSILLIVLYYGLLIIFMSAIQNGKLHRAFCYGVLLTSLLLFLIVRPYFSPYGTVTMLDVGQGDAFVIELPYRKGVILVDAGANFSFEAMEPTDSIYSRIIKPFLHSRGIQRIDAIFISHEDLDHAGSVDYIVEEFDVATIIVSPYFDIEAYTKGKWDERGVKVVRVEQGQSLEIAGYTFNILSPGVDRDSSNENSLVFHTKLGNYNWLFSGDIGKESEKEIIRTFPKLQVDVLKVAHHGSDTSTDLSFIKEIQPSIALISVGLNNRYGHPSNEVLDTLKKQGITVLRTDQDHAVLFQFNNKAGTFYRFQP